jgi:hypothetical protein
MKNKMCFVHRAAVLLAALSLSCLSAGQDARAKSSRTKSDVPLSRSLVLSHAEYLDRVQAIWTAQIIAQATGVRFEHQVASVLKQTPPSALHGHAAVDDDYYYEMVAIRAFEKYGIGLTVEELGQQWLENNAGSWGSSEQALLLLERGIKPPDTGHPRYNKLWWTIGPQFSSDVYGALTPGMPNLAASLARNLGHINGYAEGTDGAVFVAGMISIAFGEKDTHTIVRKAASLIHSDSPYRKCLDQVISMANAGRPPQEIFRAVDERWGIEYPARPIMPWSTAASWRPVSGSVMAIIKRRYNWRCMLPTLPTRTATLPTPPRSSLPCTG